MRGIDFYPDWLPMQQLVGENWDFAFTLTFGAAMDCNTNDQVDSCEIVTGSTLDSNCNGVPDECDLPGATTPDCNTNGLHDACELADDLATDCNSNATPDECDRDCNTNGIGDPCDMTEGTSTDCNTNAFPDECEMPDAFWDNGPWDHSNALVNQIGGIAPGEVADDFIVDVPGQPSSRPRSRTLRTPFSSGTAV